MTSTAWPTAEEVGNCEDVEQCLRWNRSRDNDAYVRASKSLGWGK